MSNLSFKTKITLDIIWFIHHFVTKINQANQSKLISIAQTLRLLLGECAFYARGFGGGGGGSRIRRRQGERLPDVFYNFGVLMLMDNGKN